MELKSIFQKKRIWKTRSHYIILHDTGDRGYLQIIVDNDIQIKATFEKCQSENQGDEFDFYLSCEIKTLNLCIFSETALPSTLQNVADYGDNDDNDNDDLTWGGGG